jgi:hypothetical protein
VSAITRFLETLSASATLAERMRLFALKIRTFLSQNLMKISHNLR